MREEGGIERRGGRKGVESEESGEGMGKRGRRVKRRKGVEKERGERG